MTPDPRSGMLRALREAGIVSAAQYERALAHPMSGELAGASDPADGLVWLVSHEIVPEEQLKRICTDLAATGAGDALDGDIKTLAAALRTLDGLRDKLNRERFDALVAADLITPAERDQALQQMASRDIPASPAAALAWMALSGIVGGERLSAAAVRAATDGTRQAAILAEAGAIHANARAEIKSAALDASFPGPRWLWIVAPVLVVAFVTWNAIKPTQVPDCTDAEVIRTINDVTFRLNVSALIKNPLATTVHVHQVAQEGLAKETGVRGCVAQVSVAGNDTPYAFTIAPSKGDKDAYTVTGADAAIVRARFGHLDADGAFLNKAEPIGRADVERAFRSGAAGVDMGRTAYQHALDDGNAQPASAPERLREIAEIEPMGPCREIKAGTAYSCRLLVERNDAFLEKAQGNPHMVIDSAFTFERDGTTGPWRVSANFVEEYTRAVRAQRVKAAGPLQEAP